MMTLDVVPSHATRPSTLVWIRGHLLVLERILKSDPTTPASFDATMIESTIRELLDYVDQESTRLTIANFARYITEHRKHPDTEITVLTIMEHARDRDGDPPLPVGLPPLEQRRHGAHLPPGEMRRHVVQLCEAGLTRTEIAERLNISYNAVSYHLTHSEVR